MAREIKLIFAGAGASKATSAEKYPTTIEFFTKLPPAIIRDELFIAVRNYLTHKKQAESSPEYEIVIDIEDILEEVDNAGIFANALVDENELVGTLFADANLITVLGTDGPYIKNLAEKMEGQTSGLTSRINELVYEFYSLTPSEDEMGLAWLPLLQPLLEADEWIDIFTTNYDPVIESCIDWMDRGLGLPLIATGRTNEVQRKLDLMNWDVTSTDMRQRRSSKGGGILTKLHGSIDWIRTGNTIHIGAPGFSGDHQRQVIIYPGHKGPDFDPPFDLLHEHFGRVVSEATDLVFIGFAFRDDSINQILETRTSSEARIHTINPSGPPEKMPYEIERVNIIADGFNSDSVNKLLDKLKPP